MRVSCSLVLLAVFLVLQTEAAPLDLPVGVSTSNLHLSKIKTPGVVHGAGRLTHSLFGRALLPLDTNQVLHGHIQSGLVNHLTAEVAPIGVQTTTLDGEALPLLDPPISVDGLTKRQFGGASPFSSIGNPAQIPDGAIGMASQYTGTLGKAASAIPGVSSMSSVPLLGGGMPSVPSFGGMPSVPSFGGMPNFGDMTGSIPTGSHLFGRDIFSPLSGVTNMAQGLPAVGAVRSIPVASSLQHVTGVTGAVPALTLPAGVPGLQEMPQISGLPTSPIQSLPNLNKVSDPVMGAVPALPTATGLTGLPLQAVPSVGLPSSLPSVQKVSDLPLVGSVPSMPVADGLTNLPLQNLGGGMF